MIQIIAVLLVVWLVLIILGALFSALKFLIFVGIVLFVGTAVFGAIKRRT